MMVVDIACSILQKVDERQLDTSATSMCLLNGQLYIGTGKNGLQVFDENLKHMGENKLEQLGCMYGLTPLLNETLVVAAKSGLFHINQQGKNIRKNGIYTIVLYDLIYIDVHMHICGTISKCGDKKYLYTKTNNTEIYSHSLISNRHLLSINKPNFDCI